MNANPRVPFSAPGSSPALASRRTRASTQTRSRGNSTAANLPNQRRSSLQTQAQQHEAHLHQADLPNCLCTACHLRAAVFPRRLDGRIVLPVLWNSPSESAREVSQGAPQLPGEMANHVANIAETTRNDAYALHNWGRRSEGSSNRNVRVERHTDRGEGSSRGVPRLSGPGVAPIEELPSVQPSHSNISGNVETKRRRSNADRPKSYRYPKPYDRPSEQGTPAAPLVGLGHFESDYRPGVDASSVYLYHPSSLVTSQPSIAGMESQRGPFRNMDAGPSHSLEPRAQLGNPTLNPSTSSTVSQVISQEGDHEFTALSTSTRGSRSILHPPTSPMGRRPAQSVPWRNEGQKTPHLQPSGSLDTRFSTHSRHSTPENSHRAASRTVSTVDPSRPTSFPAPTSAPSSSSFTWRPGDDDEENVIRFEEPVVHDPTTVSDQQDGQIEIKWDTERKRRQGYFSQAEEGSEKSNFRLYNQSEIDFES